MKLLQLSLLTCLATGSLVYAGGDLTPITAYEVEDEVAATEEMYAEPVEETPVYIAPTPTESVVETPAPVVPLQAKIIPNGLYAGLGITGVNYKSNCDCKNVDKKDVNYGATLRVGYDFNQYIGVEARGTKTDGDADVEHAGIFVKPMLPISNNANVYGLAGIAKTKVEGKGKLPKVDSDGVALGAGVEIDLSKDIPKEGRYSREFDGHGDQEHGVGVFVDYERMIVKDNAPDLDAVTAGVTYDF